MKILNVLLKDTRKASHSVNKIQNYSKQLSMLCLGGSLKVIRGKKPKADRCQKIYLELRPIRSRSSPFSQTSGSTRKLRGDEFLIKSDSITSPQEVTNESHST